MYDWDEDGNLLLVSSFSKGKADLMLCEDVDVRKALVLASKLNLAISVFDDEEKVNQFKELHELSPEECAMSLQAALKEIKELSTYIFSPEGDNPQSLFHFSLLKGGDEASLIGIRLTFGRNDRVFPLLRATINI